MQPSDLFRHCPRCGSARPDDNQGLSPLKCLSCGLVLYFNPTIAAAAFIFDPQGRILLIRREKDPSAGKLGVPGGFIDIGESAEEGLRREVREEVGLEIDQLRFLVSYPNVYFYRDVTYPVVDLYFTAVAVNPDTAQALDAVTGVQWQRPLDVPDEEIAFPSMGKAITLLR